MLLDAPLATIEGPDAAPASPYRTHIVRVGDMALAQMVLAAMEGFEVPHVVGNGFRRGVETFALLWGHEMAIGAETALHAIEMMSVDTSAARTTNSVYSRDEALVVKTEVIHSAWPNLRFIGDFHTHPHRVESVSSITRKRLYEYSDDDYSDVETGSDGVAYRRAGFRVGMVMTICKSKRAVPALRVADDAIRFSFGKTVFWLQANVALPEGDGLRFIRPGRKAPRVVLECPAAFGHEAPLVHERQKALRAERAR